MTTERRLTGDLPTILADLATGPYPEYIDDVLTSTARVRQRPAWTFPERWIPMAELARQPAFAPRLPWRAISVVAVLVALLLTVAAIFVGSQSRLPAPFGLARNGVIAYDAGGDIYTADPVTGEARAIITGPETDMGPSFSPDGTRVVFERKIEADDGPSQLYVARADGSELTLITPAPVTLTASLAGEPWDNYAFSPDGRTVLIASTDRGRATLSIAQADGSGVRPVDVEMDIYEPSFRPPDGREILFVSSGSIGAGEEHGIFAVDPATGVVRTIVEPSTKFGLAGATWSPDGSKIAYWAWGDEREGITARTRVISADGSGDRVLPDPAGVVWTAGSSWSNDGTRLLLVRGYTPYFEDVRPAVVPVDGRSPGVEIDHPGTVNGNCCSAWEWSPDDSKILGTPVDSAGRPMQQLIVDLVAGKAHSAPWTSASSPTWQRLAP